jgi:hypothetical protein
MSDDNTVSARALASRRSVAAEARTARNAPKHGLLRAPAARRSGATSSGRFWKRAALDDQDASEFRAFQAGARAELVPSGTLQIELVARIVTAAWRARRGDRLEAALLGRYRGSVHAELFRALAALRLLQADARDLPEDAAPDAAPRLDQTNPRNGCRSKRWCATPGLTDGTPAADPCHDLGAKQLVGMIVRERAPGRQGPRTSPQRRSRRCRDRNALRPGRRRGF